ncbi:MAG: VPLPA-CTERM sorting domain-containing protein [Arenibacterium sp.]
MKLKALIAAAGFALFAGASNAAVFTSLDTCSVTDVSATADACFGAIAEAPVNDSETLLNNNTFGGLTGLFGITDWSFLAKKDIGGGLSGTDIGLSVTGGSTAGSWSVDAGALDAYDSVTIVLKASNSFAAYLYQPGSDAGSSGSWATDAFTNKQGKVQALSHLSIYTSGVCDPINQVCGPPVGQVPIPASLPLMMGALGIVGVVARRRRKA